MKKHVIFLIGLTALAVASWVLAAAKNASSITHAAESMHARAISQADLGGIEGDATAITVSGTGDLWAGDDSGNIYFIAQVGSVPPQGANVRRVGKLPIAAPVVSLAVVNDGDRQVIYAATKNKVFCSTDRAKIFVEVQLQTPFRSFEVMQLSSGLEPDQVFLSIRTPKEVPQQKWSVLAGKTSNPHFLGLQLTHDTPHNGESLPRMAVNANHVAVNTGDGALVIDAIGPLRFHVVGIDGRFAQRVPGYGTNVVTDTAGQLYGSYLSMHPFAAGDLFPMTLNKAAGNFEPVSSPSDPDAYQAVQDAWPGILLVDNATVPNVYLVRRNGDLSNDLVYTKPGVSDSFGIYKKNVLTGLITSYHLQLSNASAASTVYFGTTHKIASVVLGQQ